MQENEFEDESEISESQSSDDSLSIMDDKQKGVARSPSITSITSEEEEEEAIHENASQWQVVETVGLVDDAEREAGGAFLFRDENGVPLLARAFPISATGGHLHVEAVALREAVGTMAKFGKEGILFCTSSTKLLRCIHGRQLAGDYLDVASEQVIQECQNSSTCVPENRFIYRSRREMERVQWLAEVGARSLQHIQWDAPLMEEIGFL